MEKRATEIHLDEYRKDKQTWLKRSLKEPIVVVDDEGKMVSRMQMIDDSDPDEAAAE